MGAYILNLDEYAYVGTHWCSLYAKSNGVIYFDNFGVEHVPKEIKRLIRHKNTKTNIFKVQADKSITRRYFCIGFIDLIFQEKKLIHLLVCFLLMILRKMMI